MGRGWPFCFNYTLLLQSHSSRSGSDESHQLFHVQNTFCYGGSGLLHLYMCSMACRLELPGCLHYVSGNYWTERSTFVVYDYCDLDLADTLCIPVPSLWRSMGQRLPYWVFPIHHSCGLCHLVLLTHQ